MQKCLIAVVLFLLFPFVGNAQDFEPKIHASVTAAIAEIQASPRPVALFPAFTSTTIATDRGPLRTDSLGWVTVTAVESNASCLLLSPHAVTPILAFGPCPAVWLHNPVTTVHFTMASLLIELNGKAEVVKQGCVVSHEIMYRGMAEVPQFWLTCRDGFFTFAC